MKKLKYGSSLPDCRIPCRLRKGAIHVRELLCRCVGGDIFIPTDKVFVMGGINGLSDSKAKETVQNYRELLDPITKAVPGRRSICRAFFRSLPTGKNTGGGSDLNETIRRIDGEQT